MREAVGQQNLHPRGQLRNIARERVTHLNGRARVLGPLLNTPAMFSPACWRPVKYSAIFQPWPVDTMPLVNTPVR